MELRAFTFSYPGVALGGVAVVIAGSYEEAFRMVFDKTYPHADDTRYRMAAFRDKWADCIECDDKEGQPIGCASIIYNWDGDY